MKAKAAGMKEQELANKALIAESKLHPDLFPKQLTAAQKDLRAQTKALREERTALHGPETDPGWRGNLAKYALDHPELYEAYPELANMIIKQGGKGMGGARATLWQSAPAKAGDPLSSHVSMDIYEEGLKNDPRSSALHEMQHAIQGVEGWSPGGSPMMAFKDPRSFDILNSLRQTALTPMSFEDYAQRFAHVSDLNKGYEQYKSSIPGIVKKMDRDLQTDAANEYYRRLAGESEARATQARRDMGNAERAQTPLSETFDVPLSDQIVKPADYAHGGPVSRDAMQIKAWDKQVQGKAAGGLTKVGKGLGKVIDAVADAKAERMKALIESERALPLRLPRAPAKTKQELARHAERVGRQMLGEHITSGKPGDTKNLAGRSRKENERIKSIEYELEPTKVIPQSTVHQSRVGDINVAFPGDYTVSDVQLKTLQGEPIGSVQQGGSRFGLGKLDMNNPLFWASNEGPAQLAQDKITDVAHLYEPERVMAQHLAMGRVANNFAQHFADASLRSIDYSKMSSKDMNLFDRIIAGGYDKKNQKTGEVESITFPHWPGIADPEAAMSTMKADPELRKWFLSRMKTPKVTKATNMPNGLDIEWAITNPDLRNMEVNLTGHSVGEMVPGASLTDTANHETYTKGIQGRYMGHQEALSPFVVSYPDAAEHIASTQRPQDFTGTIQKVFPHQIVDPQYIDEMGEYTRHLNRVLTGKKKGGAVNMAEGGHSRQPVDRSLPDLGSEERLRMEDYLRRMRFTGGGSGDKYGTGVGGRAMVNFPVGPAVVQPYVGGGVYKPQGGKLTGGVSEAGVNLVIPFADGGEVSADDLIVEERPL
jgi:hypothetical protein